jgi:hypothetical protein
MTKPVTGVAALLLWEEGRFGPADPIERFLPQLGNRRVAVLNERALAGQGPNETVPAERSITILDLMRHTSGLTYGGLGTTAVHPSNIAGATLNSAELLERLAAAPLLYQPGTVWELRALDRRHWHTCGGNLQSGPGCVPGTTAVPPARHGRHEFSGAPRQGGTARPSSAARPRCRDQCLPALHRLIWRSSPSISRGPPVST